MSKIFEYTIIPLTSNEANDHGLLNDSLDEFGESGWELIQVRRGAAYFKREVDSSPPPKSAEKPNYEEETWITWAKDEVGHVVDDFREWLQDLL